MIDISKHINNELKEDYLFLVKSFLDSPSRNKLVRAQNDAANKVERIAFENYQKYLEKIVLIPPCDLLNPNISSLFVNIRNNDFFKTRMTYFYEKLMQAKIIDIVKENNIFRYGNGQNTVAYWLLKKLNIRTCPYCNRNYIFTVRTSTDKLVRPEFDHFYPKSKMPWLALSLYNLVPSCPTCNHTKKENFISDNPYNNKPSDITIEYDSINGKVKVVPEDNENVKVFGLQDLYEGHVDYAQDVFNKAIAYNPDIYDVLLNSFQGLVKTHEELERLIWGTYLDEENFDKRPMSKLTSDILKQLGVI